MIRILGISRTCIWKKKEARGLIGSAAGRISEDKLAGDLRNAHVADRRADLACGRTCQAAIRIREVRRVERVERLQPQLKVIPILETEILEERGVQIDEAIPDNIPAGITRCIRIAVLVSGSTNRSKCPRIVILEQRPLVAGDVWIADPVGSQPRQSGGWIVSVTTLTGVPVLML